MGYQHVNLIFDPLIPGLTTTQTLVLCRLAIRANEKHLCWPGATLLAREARMTVRGVYKVLRELESAKLITKRKGTYETHYRSLYEMTYAVEHFKKLEQEKREAPPVEEAQPPRGEPQNSHSNPLKFLPGESFRDYLARRDRLGR